jgi:hypothetical protein
VWQQDGATVLAAASRVAKPTVHVTTKMIAAVKVEV